GGDGIVREYEFLTPATITINSERRQRAPYGLQGGDAGEVGKNTLQRKDNDTESISGKYTSGVESGDRIIIETPGGGGWGKDRSAK
ncbi:MAG: hydantoinase B/oxoprolinase family protein, partial [Bacteroidota bacterium]